MTLTYYAGLLDSLCSAVDRFIKVILIAAILTIFCLVCFQVALRYWLQIPLFWVEELATYVLASLVLFGTGACVKHRMHVRVTLFYDIIPRALKHILVIFVYLCVLYYSYVLQRFGWKFAELGASELSGSGTFILYYPRAVIPVAAYVIALQTFNVIVKEIMIWVGHESETDDLF